MKHTLLLSALLLTLFSCNMSSDTDYKNISKDTCDCVNLFTADLSDEMIQVMVDSDGDEAKLEAGMMAYMAEDPEAGLKDAQILQGSGMQDMTTCMEKVEKKYDDVYTMLSEDQVLQKILTELESMDGCETAKIILKMGIGK